MRRDLDKLPPCTGMVAWRKGLALNVGAERGRRATRRAFVDTRDWNYLSGAERVTNVSHFLPPRFTREKQ